MKLWAILATAGLLVGSAIANSTPAQNEPNKWNIQVGFAIPTGDHENLGVENMFSIGADWMLNDTNMSDNLESFIGLLAMFGNGDGNFDSVTYGAHYGLIFGLGNPGSSMNNFMVKLQGGIFNTRLDDGIGDSDEWGFGGSANLLYVPQNSSFKVGAGYYFMPDVNGIDNRGWSIFVTIPVK